MAESDSKKDIEANPQKPQFKLITAGLADAGKTALIHRLTHGEPPKAYIATKAVTVHIIQEDSTVVQAWDQMGRGRYRALSKMFYIGTTGIIFMIDSADVSQFDSAMGYLNIILQEEEVTNMTLMVVANKQDLSDAVGPEVLEEKIKETCKIGPGVSVFVMPMSVTTEDDHSVQLAYSLFVKTMKRKEGGKVEGGLIPCAWETAEKDVEDSGYEWNSDDIADAYTQDHYKGKENEKKDILTTKESLAMIADTWMKSLFQDPVHFLKSLLTY